MQDSFPYGQNIGDYLHRASNTVPIKINPKTLYQIPEGTGLIDSASPKVIAIAIKINNLFD
jgi:hypothetical protein